MSTVALAFIFWCGNGVIALHVATPRWMKHADPVGFALMNLVACVAGPLGWLWLLFSPNTEDDLHRDTELRTRQAAKKRTPS